MNFPVKGSQVARFTLKFYKITDQVFLKDQAIKLYRTMIKTSSLNGKYIKTLHHKIKNLHDIGDVFFVDLNDPKISHKIVRHFCDHGIKASKQNWCDLKIEGGIYTTIQEISTFLDESNIN